MTEQSDMARRPMVNLDGRTAIITGSGKGIGAAVAKCLASHGAAVVINYVHDAASAQRTVEDIHSLGGLAIAVQADVCDESQSSKLVGTAVDSFGGVDILVNNAFGRFSFDPRRRSTFAGGDWDEFSAQIEGCLHGAYLMCSHVVPLMRAQTSGRIINISSNLVDSPIVPYHSYITAKGGLVGMTRSLAQELGGFGITETWHQLVFLGVVNAFIWMGESWFEYLLSLKWRKLAQNLQHDLRLDTYDHVQKLEMAY